MEQLHIDEKDLEQALIRLESQPLQDPYSSTLQYLRAVSLINRLQKKLKTREKGSALQSQNQTDSAENFEITPE